MEHANSEGNGPQHSEERGRRGRLRQPQLQQPQQHRPPPGVHNTSTTGGTSCRLRLQHVATVLSGKAWDDEVELSARGRCHVAAVAEYASKTSLSCRTKSPQVWRLQPRATRAQH